MKRKIRVRNNFDKFCYTTTKSRSRKKVKRLRNKIIRRKSINYDSE